MRITVRFFTYLFIVFSLLQNAIAMDVPKPTQPVQDPLAVTKDIQAAYARAAKEGREVHILLGASPLEPHIVKLLEAEKLREQEEAKSAMPNAFKAPVRIFFNRAYGEYVRNVSTPEIPIVNANFNEAELWDPLMKAANLKPLVKFKGPVDKIYFDHGTAYFANWGTIVLTRITTLLKPNGKLYIPDGELVSKFHSFKDSTYGPQDVKTMNPSELKALPLPLNMSPTTNHSIFLSGGGQGLRGILDPRTQKTHFYHGGTIVYDVTFAHEVKGGNKALSFPPLKFEEVNDGKAYPDIGGEYREQKLNPITNFIVVSQKQ